MTIATTGLRIVTATERLAERRGVKLALFGPTGVGKTTQLRNLPLEVLGSTLFIDIEAGDLAVAGLSVASIRPRTWADYQDIAAILGGPDPALPPTAAYSESHYKDAVANSGLADLASYDTLFIDSITAASRVSFIWAEQQAEAYTDRGRKDLRAIYGLHARNMLAWLSQFQQARSRNVIFVGILEKVTDSYGVATWQPQIEGAKTGRELPGIVDQVVTMNWIDFGDHKSPVRAFVCTSPNPWNYPAKDRSGKLDQLEEPHLGRLLTKLTSSKSST
jgi:hypothetical protein